MPRRRYKGPRRPGPWRRRFRQYQSPNAMTRNLLSALLRRFSAAVPGSKTYTLVELSHPTLAHHGLIPSVHLADMVPLHGDLRVHGQVPSKRDLEPRCSETGRLCRAVVDV